jgi:ATP-dependent DNA helicase RecQ
MVDQVDKWNREFVLTESGQLHPRTAQSTSTHPVAVLLGSAQADPQVESNALLGLYPVVYLAPEKLTHLSPSIVAHVRCLVIDECHCISEQGKSFRPAYRTIRPFFPEVITLALTATAPPEIQQDILENLALGTPVIIRESMARPNLYLRICPKHTRADDVATIRGLETPMGRTVVFGTTRAECESLAQELGPTAEAYHAGLSLDERAHAMRNFVLGKTLVATNCFGLGVDMPDIRTVVHYGLPRSLLGYVQECGRAGRDGQPATCILFFAPSDISKYNTTERDVRLAKEMLYWAQEIQCRHRTLLRRFGEPCAEDRPCVWGPDQHPGNRVCVQCLPPRHSSLTPCGRGHWEPCGYSTPGELPLG